MQANRTKAVVGEKSQESGLRLLIRILLICIGMPVAVMYVIKLILG